MEKIGLHFEKMVRLSEEDIELEAVRCLHLKLDLRYTASS